MTQPVEDNESLNSNKIHFCFAKSFLVRLRLLNSKSSKFSSPQAKILAIFLHFRLRGSNLAMKLPSKISFVIFFNSAYEISFTFLTFSSNFLNFYKNFLKIYLRSESYPPYGKWIWTFMKGC